MGKQYFYNLNYSLANEDTSLEWGIAKKHNPKKILSVCGSGGRVTPLVHKEAELITAVDISKIQLELLKLRLSTYKKFSYKDYLEFWGFAPYTQIDLSKEREELFYKLELDPVARGIFKDIFENNNWESILYLGKWEKTFVLFSKMARLFLGNKIDEFFRLSDMESQKLYMERSFPHLRWNLIVTILGNKSVFNTLLYKGDFVKKNIPESYYRYYKQAFNHLFTNQLMKESFFVQLCFLGAILYPEGNVIEAHEETFLRVKDWINNNGEKKVRYVNNDLISELESGIHKYDFVSLSDVPSYFEGELEKNFMQRITKGLNKNAIVVLRSYLRVPNANLKDYTDVSSEYRDLISKESVQMYKVNIYKYVGELTGNNH